MHDNAQSGEELVYRDDDSGEPTDGICAHRADITSESVQHIAVAVAVDGHPVGIDDFIEDVALYVVVDVYLQFQCYASQHIADDQSEERTAHHHENHDPQFRHLIARNDIDEVFSGDTRHQSQCRAQDTEYDIEGDGFLVAFAIGENPPPVVKDFTQCAVAPFGENGEQGFKG